MTHPQLEAIILKIDEVMEGYPSLSQNDRLADLSKKTGYPKAYFFSAAVSLLTSLLSAIGGMKLISDLIGFIYPAYMSFTAIESEGKDDDAQWLMYWVVFAKFSILEGTVMFLLEYIPFYYVVKTVFMVWLFHPKFRGAEIIYGQGMPILKKLTEPAEKPQKPAVEEVTQKKEE